jgi:hypothetical protein
MLSKLRTQFLQHKFLLSLAGVVILVFVTAVVVLLLNNSQKRTADSQANNSSSTDFIQKVNQADLQSLNSVLSDDANITAVTNTTVEADRDAALNQLILFLATHTGGFNAADLSSIDLEAFPVPSGMDISNYQLLVYADGSAVIAYKVVDGKVTDLVLLISEVVLPSSTTSSFSSTSSLSSSQANSSTGTIERSLKLRYMTSTDSSITVKSETDTSSVPLLIESTGFVAGSKCTLRVYRTKDGTKLSVDQMELSLDVPAYTKLIDFTAGENNLELSCTAGDKTYKATGNVTVVMVPVSICDAKQFVFQKADKTFDEVKDGIIGTWRGCMFDPWSSKPFEVEFVFKADGTYESRNIEISKNPNTLRTNPALYYGSDANLPGKKFELKNQLTNGEVEGDLYIAFSASNDGAVLDKIRSVSLSADGNKLYFEVIHLSNYGPLRYKLEKQVAD